VQVLDIDRDRQRISLGLKQTQTDPWQQVLDSYQEGDVVQGTVTKVVTFGAFVEILPGVEGLVHISELAQHHVENPREIVSQGDQVNVRILEVDGEEGEPPALGLSDEVFADEVPAAEALEPPAAEAEPVAEEEPVAEAEAEVVEEEPAVAEPEPEAEEPVAEAEPEATAEEPAAEEPEPAARVEAEAPEDDASDGVEPTE
jgi:small subunit ribosomal protein S1